MKNELITPDGLPAREPVPAPQPRALLLESDTDTRELMKLILEMKGYIVLAIEDGEQYLAQKEELPPDLIIVNIVPPADEDLRILQQIRQRLTLPHVPIIVTSSYPTPIIRSEALRAGCIAFFAKPIDFDKLNSLIEQFLPHQETSH